MSKPFMRKLNPFKPTDIGGCQLWLDGADPAGTGRLPANNSPLSIWTDKSGSGNNATTFNNLFPTFFQKSAYTNLPFVQFNGTNWANQTVTGVTVMALPNFQNTASVSCFYVCLGNATYFPTQQMRPLFIYKGVFVDGQVYLETNPANVGIGLQNPSFNPNISSTALGNTVYLNSAVFNSAAGTFSGGQNGSNSTISTGSSSWNTAPASISLGAYFDTSNQGFQNLAFNGELYEVIVFNSAVTPAQRQKVEGYLAQKWGLQANLPAGSPGRTGVIYPRTLLIDSLTTGQPTRLPFFRPLRVSIITPGSVFHLDAGNPVSYPGSGSTWTDLAGSGLTTTLFNTPTYSSANGGYLAFAAASSQYAQTSASLTAATRWTVELWHYYTGTNSGGAPCILSEVFNSTPINFTIGCATGGNTTLQAAYFNGGWYATTNTYSLPSVGWYQIVGTYDGTNIKLYINNVLTQTSTSAGTPASSGLGIRLMRRWDLGDYWGGYLAIVRIYNRALLSTEVTTNYAASKARFGLS